MLIILESSGQQLNGQMISLALHLHLLALFLIIAFNLQKQHRTFQKSYLKLKDDPHNFVLKSWKILQHRTLPKAFGVTLIRKRKHVMYNQDVVTMMVSL